VVIFFYLNHIKKEFINSWFQKKKMKMTQIFLTIANFSIDEFKRKFLPSMPMSKIIEELLGKH